MIGNLAAPRRNRAIAAVGLALGLAITQPAYAQSHGTRQQTLFSEALNEDRVLNIWLPDGYAGSESTYPVLYVLDAESPEGWTQAVRTVTETVREGSIPEMIVVGIHNTIRNRDMIPAVVAHRPGSGGSEEFLRFIGEELLPHIDAEFRTDGRNILYGGSNAGLFTVYAMLSRPEAFVGAIAGSPMIGHCSDYMYQAAEQLAHAAAYDGKSLFLIYGDNDSQRCTEYVPAFHDHLRSIAPAGFNSELVVVENGGHVPPESLYRGLIYVFSNNPLIPIVVPLRQVGQPP